MSRARCCECSRARSVDFRVPRIKSGGISARELLSISQLTSMTDPHISFIIDEDDDGDSGDHSSDINQPEVGQKHFMTGNLGNQVWYSRRTSTIRPASSTTPRSSAGPGRRVPPMVSVRSQSTSMMIVKPWSSFSDPTSDRYSSSRGFSPADPQRSGVIRFLRIGHLRHIHR